MRQIKKRGLSPVIASVLLIALVIVLIAIILLWSYGFIGEQIEKFGENIEEYCESVEFSASLIKGPGTLDTLEITNRGNVDINSIEIKIFKDGNAEIKRYNMIIKGGKATSREIELRMDDGTYPSEMEIFPVLAGNIKGRETRKPFVCTDDSEALIIN